MSRTLVYIPRGNGQTERYNGIVWSAVAAALKSRNLPVTQWETVLPDALHSVRSLCSSPNATPHERMFAFSRRSSIGLSRHHEKIVAEAPTTFVPSDCSILTKTPTKMT